MLTFRFIWLLLTLKTLFDLDDFVGLLLLFYFINMAAKCALLNDFLDSVGMDFFTEDVLVSISKGLWFFLLILPLIMTIVVSCTVWIAFSSRCCSRLKFFFHKIFAIYCMQLSLQVIQNRSICLLCHTMLCLFWLWWLQFLLVWFWLKYNSIIW